MRTNIAEKRIEAQNILARRNMSDDLKLHEVFQIYKEDLQREYSQIYYALLAWRDTHLSEIHKEQYEARYKQKE